MKLIKDFRILECMESYDEKIDFKKFANKTKQEEDIRNYNSKRNLVVQLNFQSKKQHFMLMQSKKIGNDKIFRNILDNCYKVAFL